MEILAARRASKSFASGTLMVRLGSATRLADSKRCAGSIQMNALIRLNPVAVVGVVLTGFSINAYVFGSVTGDVH